ncbi:hypothetical protein NFI96_005124 [Prochilodus magdalenae]|nr:hypothetical protein NFI96_005124 [Prochilodus magdalenae]
MESGAPVPKTTSSTVARRIYGVTEPSDSPTASEYADAELKAIRQAQMDYFPSEVTNLKAGKSVPSNSRLLCLAPEFDRTTQLVRVGGRLRRSGLLERDVIHPIVLDHQHPLTKLIIKDYDDKLHHPVPERVFAEARRKYWVLQGREAVRRHQRKCTDCRKWRGRPNPPRMADLPPARLRIYKPAFYTMGVDCFGPYVIKVGCRNEKRWGILFKCMTSRAVYNDLLARLDLDSFLMALRRFMARRGRPHEILCDQGTNFRGGEKELQESFAALYPDLQAQLASQQIKFSFNPPNAPLFGGCWEREIRSLKTALRVTLGAQTVPKEVLKTVLIEIEGILDSKPLGYTSSDIADPDPITPNSLLMGRRDVSLPQVWFDRDDPSGNGDYETLEHLRTEYPGKICSKPLGIQATTMSGVPAKKSGRVIQTCHSWNNRYEISDEDVEKLLRDLKTPEAHSRKHNESWLRGESWNRTDKQTKHSSG